MLDYFNTYILRTDHLENLSLPVRLWKFINSNDSKSFDVLDIQHHFSSDIQTAENILNYLLDNQICEKTETKHLTQHDWLNHTNCESEKMTIETCSKKHPASTSTTEASITSNHTTHDTNITVDTVSSDVFVEIG